MADLIHFIVSHWLLVSVTMAFAVMAITLEQPQLGASTSSSTPNQVVALLNREDALLIDLRTPAVFTQGHVLGALNIEAQQLLEATKLPRELASRTQQPWVLACQTGKQSLAVLKQLAALKPEKLFTLSGGMDAWHQQPLPVVSSRELS